MKLCKTCKTEKSVECFSRNKRMTDGLQRDCKQCCKAYKAKYYEANAEKVKAKVKEYRIENPELVKASKSSWQKRNLTKVVQKVSEWRDANPDKVFEHRKTWRQNNKEKIANYAMARRVKLRENGVFEISEKELLKLYSSPCFYCGKIAKIELDHVIPVSKGGTHSIGNLVPACKSCNMSKTDNFLVVWKMKMKGMQIGNH